VLVVTVAVMLLLFNYLLLSILRPEWF